MFFVCSTIRGFEYPLFEYSDFMMNSIMLLLTPTQVCISAISALFGKLTSVNFTLCHCTIDIDITRTA